MIKPIFLSLAKNAEGAKEIKLFSHYRTIFQILLVKQTQNGLQSRFTVKRFCKSFF